MGKVQSSAWAASFPSHAPHQLLPWAISHTAKVCKIYHPSIMLWFLSEFSHC